MFVRSPIRATSDKTQNCQQPLAHSSFSTSLVSKVLWFEKAWHLDRLCLGPAHKKNRVKHILITHLWLIIYIQKHAVFLASAPWATPFSSKRIRSTCLAAHSSRSAEIEERVATSKKSGWVSIAAWTCKLLCIIIGYYSGWWFQPLWKILVSRDDYSQHMEK